MQREGGEGLLRKRKCERSDIVYGGCVEYERCDCRERDSMRKHAASWVILLTTTSTLSKMPIPQLQNLSDVSLPSKTSESVKSVKLLEHLHDPGLVLSPTSLGSG